MNTEALVRTGTLSQARRASFERHPAPPSVYQQLSRSRGRWLFGLVGVGALMVWLVLSGIGGGLFVLSSVGIGLTVLVRAPFFIHAWMRRRLHDAVWREDPEWAFARLLEYHEGQTRIEAQQLVLRREHHVEGIRRVRRTMFAWLPALVALCFCFVADPLWYLIGLNLSNPIVAVSTLALGVCLIYVLPPARRHMKAQSKIKRYEHERETFRAASEDISEGKLLVGAISEIDGEGGGQMTLTSNEES